MDEPASTAMRKFSVFDHPLLPQRIFCIPVLSWPVFFIGPFWYLWKRLWMPAAVIFVGTTIFFFFLDYGGVFSRTVCDQTYSWMCHEEENNWVQFLFQIVINFFCAAAANEIWSQDLLRRGYVVSRVVEANSVDHVRAILARK